MQRRSWRSRARFRAGRLDGRSDFERLVGRQDQGWVTLVAKFASQCLAPRIAEVGVRIEGGASEFVAEIGEGGPAMSILQSDVKGASTSHMQPKPRRMLRGTSEARAMMESDQPALERVWLIAIGASGHDGFRDIKNLLSQFDRTLPAVVLVVFHRSFDHASRLRDILAAGTDLEVIVVDEAERLRPGCCYIGEPARHLTLLSHGFGETTADQEREYRNRTVDLLFRSVADHAAERAIAVVLSGALDDGSRGLEAIHHAGGRTMVVTPRGEPGMPANAIKYDGPVDCIGTTEEIVQAILRIVARPPMSPARR